MARKTFCMNLKLLFFFFLAFSLAACSVPGTYLSNADVHSQIKINGQWIYPTVIPINVNLFATREGQVESGILWQDQQYVIGPHDILSINIWGHQDLLMSDASPGSSNSVGASGLSGASGASGTVVNAKGDIFFPFVGEVKVAGLTLSQARELLSSRLQEYIRSPQVQVNVASFRSQQVYVLGEVTKPGVAPLTDKPMSILDAINAGGGVSTLSSNVGSIYVIRGPFTDPKIFLLDAHSPQAMLVSEKFFLRDNDILYVSTASIAGWNRVMSQILPTVQTIWFTHSITSAW